MHRRRRFVGLPQSEITFGLGDLSNGFDESVTPLPPSRNLLAVSVLLSYVSGPHPGHLVSSRHYPIDWIRTQ